jgi:gluconolactonase
VESGFTDAIRVSSSGLIFVALFGGVDIYHPDGTRLGKINIPEASANGDFVEKHVVNMVFEGNTLWCFATGGLYRVPGLLVTGDPRLV